MIGGERSWFVLVVDSVGDRSDMVERGWHVGTCVALSRAVDREPSFGPAFDHLVPVDHVVEATRYASIDAAVVDVHRCGPVGIKFRVERIEFEAHVVKCNVVHVDPVLKVQHVRLPFNFAT